MTSLYLHIPFCKNKCAYCSFYSQNSDYKSEYIDALIRSVKYYGKKCSDKISSVYVGGGTPSVLEERDILRMFDAVFESFEVCPGAEITIEANPESTDLRFLKTVKSAGVNRLSLGVQSFDDDELCKIGRLHDGKGAKRAVRLAFDAGFDNISCDLIFGLPGSDVQSFENNLEILTELGVPHISCYNLQLEKGTPLYDKKPVLPSEREQEQMYFSACEFLKKRGFLHYEVSNFARRGFESRHNCGYWTGRDYIGLGPSAHSKVGSVRFCFDADSAAFIKRQDFEPDKKEEITDARFEALMLGLRTSRGVLLSDIPKSGGYVNRLVFGGFANIEKNRLVLTDKGFYLSNTIISDIANTEGI